MFPYGNKACFHFHESLPNNNEAGGFELSCGHDPPRQRKRLPNKSDLGKFEQAKRDSSAFRAMREAMGPVKLNSASGGRRCWGGYPGPGPGYPPQHRRPPLALFNFTGPMASRMARKADESLFACSNLPRSLLFGSRFLCRGGSCPQDSSKPPASLLLG